jgi:hypothetical protein
MNPRLHRIIAVLVLAFGLGSCESGTQKIDSEMRYSNPIAFRLPPDPIWTNSGTALVIPAQTPAPSIRAANCFAGVPTDLDFGIGASIGITKSYIAAVTLPVNLHLESHNLGAFRIRVDVSNPAVVTIDTSNITGITGSNPVLAAGNCIQRGCPVNCGSVAGFTDDFSAAPGFEHVDHITTPAVGSVTVETVNNSLTPTTGTVNLCNIKFIIVGDLPPAGVKLTFTIERLDDEFGAAITGAVPIDGVIIEHCQLN